MKEAPEELLTVDDVCSWLKVTRDTLDRWRREGMPYVKIRKLVRFKKSDVEQWIEAQNK